MTYKEFSDFIKEYVENYTKDGVFKLEIYEIKNIWNDYIKTLSIFGKVDYLEACSWDYDKWIYEVK